MIPSIISFSQNVPGGNQSKLIIEGGNFGTSPGKMIFKKEGFTQEPDDGISLDNYDLSSLGNLSFSWDESRIEIQLPSSVYDIVYYSELFEVSSYVPKILMSAEFKVISSDGQESPWTSSKLNIPFSLYQELVIDETTDA